MPGLMLNFKQHLYYNDWNTNYYKVSEISVSGTDRDTTARVPGETHTWPKTISRADVEDQTRIALTGGQSINQRASQTARE